MAVKARRVDPRDLVQLAESPVKFRRVVGLFRPHRWRLFLVMAVIVESSFVALGQPMLIRAIVDRALPEGDRRLLILCVLGLVAVAATNGVLGITQAWLTTSVGQSIMNDLRTRVFAHLQRQSINFFTRTRGGEIQSRLTNDVAGLQSVITNTATSVITSLTTFLATLVAMLMLSWRLTILTAVVLPPAAWLARRVAHVRRDITAERQRKLADLSTQVQTSLSVDGAFLTKTLGIEQQRQGAFTETSVSLGELEVRSRMAGKGRMAAVDISFAAIPAVVYLAAGFPEVTGAISLGTVIAFTTLQAAIFKPVVNMLNMGADWVASLALLSRVFGYLDLPVEVEEPAHPTPLPHGSLRGEVVFDDVSYRYPGTDTDVLSHVRLTIPAGGSAALVGETGSGKSTLGHLLARLADPTSGRILIDGVDLRTLSSSDRTRAVAIVSQNTYLVHDTLRTNLRLARPDATDEELWEALEVAQVADLVRGLPEGLDTVAGEHGYRFSGGEKQRLAIARTLLRDPRILILDEATSALDNETEHELQAALSALMRGRTTLTIAHRFNTIRDADTIHVLEQGRLVERGTYERLLSAAGTFTRLAPERLAAEVRP